MKKPWSLQAAPSRLAGGVFVVVALLYLAFPAARFNFDGVACAIAVDTGNLRHLFHGNHLAYGFLGHLFSGFLGLLRMPMPALFSLQIFSSLLGAGAAGVFSLVLLECGINPFIAALGAVGLGLSRIFWIWSLEAQVYALGAFFLFFAAREAFRPDPRPVRLGILHAGAVLGHIGHFMFLPAAIYLLDGKKERLRYATALSAAIIAAYAAAALGVGPGSWEDVRVWLLGSAALAVNKSFGWHGGYSWQGLLAWLRMSVNMVGIGFVGGATLIAAAAVGGVASWKDR